MSGVGTDDKGVLNYLNKVGGISGSTSAGSGRSGGGNLGGWYLALAQAAGKTLDAKASQMTELSAEIRAGGADNPSNIALLSASAMQFQFLSTSASGVINGIGEALKTSATSR